VTVFTRADATTEEHRGRHPLGRVPVLEVDDGYLFESAALCLHLADSYPRADLIPPPASHARALVYQWTLFAMTELEPAVVAVFDNEEGSERARAGAERFKAGAVVVERTLEGHEFLVDDRFTVADIVTGAVVGDAARMGMLSDLPNLAAYTERLQSRPARQRTDAVGR
jgi:glutathione S-transferase